MCKFIYMLTVTAIEMKADKKDKFAQRSQKQTSFMFGVIVRNIFVFVWIQLLTENALCENTRHTIRS